MRKWLAAAAALSCSESVRPRRRRTTGSRHAATSSRPAMAARLPRGRPPRGRTGADGPAPAILTLSPYSVLGRNGDAHRWVVPARLRARLGRRCRHRQLGRLLRLRRASGEKESGYDLVEWLAAQPWSTGKVGDDRRLVRRDDRERDGDHAAAAPDDDRPRGGDLALVRTTRSPAASATSTTTRTRPTRASTRRLGFDFGLAFRRRVDATDPTWADRSPARTSCRATSSSTRSTATTTRPTTTRSGSSATTSGARRTITIPVLVAYNWGDWNVKQEESINLYRALTRSANRKLYAGTRWSRPRHARRRLREDGRRTGPTTTCSVSRTASRLIPDVHSEMSDYNGALGLVRRALARDEGGHALPRRSSAADYPWRLLPNSRARAELAARRRSSRHGTNTETIANANPRANARLALVRAAPLARDARIFGEVQVRLCVDDRSHVDHVHADDRRHRPDRRGSPARPPARTADDRVPGPRRAAGSTRATATARARSRS